MAFLCIEPDSPTTDIFLIATITVLSFGGLCCCISFIIFCKYRVKKNSAIDDEEAYINRVHDPIAAQRILEEQNKLKLTLVAKVLSKKKFSQTQYKENQQSCAICVEDFLPVTLIRETPCHHIFHE